MAPAHLIGAAVGGLAYGKRALRHCAAGASDAREGTVTNS